MICPPPAERSHMPRKLGLKLILSLTVLIVAISGISGYLNFRSQKRQLVDNHDSGADQLSRGITGATWHAMLDDDRKAAYEIMRVIADKQGVDRIRMYNREGRLAFSTDAGEQLRMADSSSEVCSSCHSKDAIRNHPTAGCASALRNVSKWGKDHQHGGAHLQRAFVQQRELSCSQRVDQSARSG